MNWRLTAIVIAVLIGGCTSGSSSGGDGAAIGYTRAQLAGEEPIEVITGTTVLPDGTEWDRERSIFVEGDTIDRWFDPAGHVETTSAFLAEESVAADEVHEVRGSMVERLKALRDAAGETSRYHVVGWLAVR